MEQSILVVRAGSQLWGIRYEWVGSIAPVAEVRRVPFAPPALRGVINWQGEVAPLIDLSGRLGLPAEPAGPTTRMVVCQAPPPAAAAGIASLVALQVEAVGQVLRATEAQVRVPGPEEMQHLAGNMDPGLLSGVIVENGQEVWILDLPALFRRPLEEF